MNPKVNYIVVGVFVLSLCLATIVFALWLAFGYGEKTLKYYLIYMNESVAGLSKDAVVKFSGVNVGTVEDIKLGNDPSQVVIKIGVNENTPVNVDTRATLMSQGLTGLSYINLGGGAAQSKPLLPLPGQRYAVIPTNPSLFIRLDATISKLTTSLDHMSRSVDYLLRPENQKSVSTILHNMAKVTSSMAEHSDEIGRSFQQMPQAVQAMNQTFDTLNTQTLPGLNSSLMMMAGVMPSFSNFVQQLSENPSVIWRGPKVNQLGPGEEANG